MKIKSIKSIGIKKTHDISVKDNHNFVLSNNIITHNSGKTWLMRSSADRLLRSNKLVFFPVDVKNELFSSAEPLQPKFHHLLLKGEKPEGFETITLRPTFFKSLPQYNELPKGNVWFSVKLSDITQGDFKLLVNYYGKGVTDNQRISFDLIWEELKKTPFTSWEQIDAIVDGMPHQSDMQCESLKRKFVPLKLSHFYEEEHCRDIIPAIEKGVVFGINFENFESFGRENNGMCQAFLAMMLRKVIMARRAKRLSKPIHILIDEVSRFIPLDQETATKLEVQQSVQLDARYGVNYWFAIQEWDMFPEDIINQCRYMMLPSNSPVPIIEKALKSSGLTRYVQRSYQDAVQIKQQMRRHEWLVIDRTLQTKEIIMPLAPLSCHAETTK